MNYRLSRFVLKHINGLHSLEIWWNSNIHFSIIYLKLIACVVASFTDWPFISNQNMKNFISGINEIYNAIIKLVILMSPIRYLQSEHFEWPSLTSNLSSNVFMLFQVLFSRSCSQMLQRNHQFVLVFAFHTHAFSFFAFQMPNNEIKKVVYVFFFMKTFIVSLFKATVASPL